jgi:hypothetical protein
MGAERMLKQRQHEYPRLIDRLRIAHSTIESWREGANFLPATAYYLFICLGDGIAPKSRNKM